MDSDNRAGVGLADRAEERPEERPEDRPGGRAEDRPDGPAGWRYLLDDGVDPAGRIPVHLVRGGTPPGPGGDRAHRPNPRHGRPLPQPPAAADAPALPPLEAGRRPAGRALLAWLEDTRAPRLCRIAGSSGSGRTHLLTWLAAACPPDHPRPGRRVHALLDAEGLTVRSATARLADLLGLTAGEPAELLEALQDGTPRTVVVTDLDRAGGPRLPGTPERLARELLVPLLSVPWLLLVVEAAHGPAADALTAAAPTGAVLDLDQPQWTDPDKYAAWCARLTGHPVDPAATHPSPGLAQLAARTPGAAPDPTRPPAERATALAEAWWDAVPGPERAALTALAGADGPISTALWATLPGTDPDGVAAATRLLPPPPIADRWRLRPQQLTDLVAADSPPVDHAALMWEVAGGIPVRPDGGPDLAASDPERLALLVRHASAADPGTPLLGEIDLLLHAEPATVTAAFQRAEDAGTPATPLAEAWRRAAPDRTATARPADRAAVLHAHLTGRHDEAAAHCAALAARVDTRWRAVWQHTPAAGPCAATLGFGPLAGRLLLTDAAGLHLADPATGEVLHSSAPPAEPHPRALTATPFGGALLLNASGTLRPLTVDGHQGVPDGALAALDACTAVAAHRDVMVFGRPDGLTTYSEISTGTTHRPEHPLHEGPVTALDVAEADGGTLVASGGEDGRVWTWMPGRPPLPAPVDQRARPVTAVALGATPGGLLLAAAWSDGLLRLRRWGERHRGADLRLGAAVRTLSVTPDGLVIAALPGSVLALALVDGPAGPVSLTAPAAPDVPAAPVSPAR
ncbi:MULTISPECIES: hypothetical protein [Kitasatospora]|uniref:WD-40 repeat protein n=1 Tax=Kitasatospora setae (strain ATCC 33774 / DSM 43861 / JCM 3304 / KCC A-0304 / NBRC 14216 / KM-6054) TaxID=452652 RepID=E4N0T1_KITSK|nr:MULTISPECIES: hypothetical protein [Kitasatospora]BAJ31765.1 hypothetical protein KSE_59950 [Kitasatospora setae KM-6054]